MSNANNYNVWELARMADCASPDDEHSPGATFLLGVQADMAERVAWAADNDEVVDEDVVSEVAGGAVPVYTHELWQAFVDLCAYAEDISDYGTDAADMTATAGVALYCIAERLAFALRAEEEIENR